MSDNLPVPVSSPTAPTGISDLVYVFLAGRSAATLRAYQRDLEDFRHFLGEPSLNTASERLLGAGHGGANALAYRYRAHLLERGLQAATINRRIAALRSLVKLARLFGLVTWSLETPGVASQPYRDTRGPGAENFRRMLAALGEEDTPRLRRDRAILRLLYDIGLRRGEAVSLDITDVDIAGSRIAVRGKGRREKSLLTLPPTTLATLLEWLEVRGTESGPLFLSFDRARKGDGRLSVDAVYLLVRDLGAAIGVKVAPHGLRHTAITEACKAAQNAGIGLEEVLDFSRHKNVSVLMLYRDRERNVQGQLANLVAATTGTASITCEEPVAKTEIG